MGTEYSGGASGGGPGARGAYAGLYVHAPFCVRKCAYCDFYSCPDPTPDQVATFLSALRREAAVRPADFAPTTIYMGGGTPTSLPAAALDELLDIVRAVVDMRRVREWTVEANPESFTPEKAARLRRAGVNRISLGAQSFDDARLAWLGRPHTAADTRAAVGAARAAGFRRLNLDLIYGTPGLTPDAWRRELEDALALAPGHLSLYALSVEAGTALAARRAAGERVSATDDEAADQYAAAVARLTAAGYPPYELSNFARPGHACRHNLLYWSGGEYLGWGPAAHSHRRGERWSNPASLGDYAARLAADRSPAENRERLDPAARARETLVFSLRRTAGVRRAQFRRRTGMELDDAGGEPLRRLRTEGRLLDDGIRVRLAPDRWFVSNDIFSELI